GAGGLIAGEAFAKSPNDGYTLFVGANGPVLFAPEITKRDAYNWKRDFIPITTISMTPLVLEVHPSVKAQTVKEFFDLVRREPGKLSMASPGAGTTNHLLSELAQSALGLQWVTVHYRGNAPATNDLIGGQVHFAFDQISVALQYFKSGMLRPLAVTSAQRNSRGDHADRSQRSRCGKDLPADDRYCRAAADRLGDEPVGRRRAQPRAVQRLHLRLAEAADARDQRRPQGWRLQGHRAQHSRY